MAAGWSSHGCRLPAAGCRLGQHAARPQPACPAAAFYRHLLSGGGLTPALLDKPPLPPAPAGQRGLQNAGGARQKAERPGPAGELEKASGSLGKTLRQGRRSPARALQTGPEPSRAVQMQSRCLLCTLDTNGHPPLSAGHIGCIAKLVPLLSGPFEHTAQQKAAAPAAEPAPRSAETQA